MRWNSFNEWKTFAVAFLVKLPVPEEAEMHKTVLLRSLEYCRLRDLGRWLIRAYEFSIKYRVDLRRIFPTEEEINHFHRRGEAADP